MGSKDYKNLAWLEFREQAFLNLGYHCSRCSRSDEDVVLQVHHKIYIDGRKPWEYNLVDCEVLCRGCHAREHGLIRPAYDWNLSHSSDLGSLVGTCELCKSSLRFEFHLFHNDWSEPLTVGTVCCDHLTGDEQATKYKKKIESFERFQKSPRWHLISNDESYYSKNKFFSFYLRKKDGDYFIEINKKKGNMRFKNVNEAQFFLFDFIRENKHLEIFSPKGEFLGNPKNTLHR